ncbi:hypothetical protein L3X38_022212 [Prunus dulcis]|uniref:Uncharacterized protein n=1 Tax=Prunus dulcis TaxID=3755 RepID=A0AAD4VVJ2_PRUDU|nr:hypothetical protein L3X38_022212 [Prunus dulcis]
MCQAHLRSLNSSTSLLKPQQDFKKLLRPPLPNGKGYEEIQSRLTRSWFQVTSAEDPKGPSFHSLRPRDQLAEPVRDPNPPCKLEHKITPGDTCRTVSLVLPYQAVCNRCVETLAECLMAFSPSKLPRPPPILQDQARFSLKLTLPNPRRVAEASVHSQISFQPTLLNGKNCAKSFEGQPC